MNKSVVFMLIALAAESYGAGRDTVFSPFVDFARYLQDGLDSPQNMKQLAHDLESKERIQLPSFSVPDLTTPEGTETLQVHGTVEVMPLSEDYVSCNTWKWMFARLQEIQGRALAIASGYVDAGHPLPTQDVRLALEKLSREYQGLMKDGLWKKDRKIEYSWRIPTLNHYGRGGGEWREIYFGEYLSRVWPDQYIDPAEIYRYVKFDHKPAHPLEVAFGKDSQLSMPYDPTSMHIIVIASAYEHCLFDGKEFVYRVSYLNRDGDQVFPMMIDFVGRVGWEKL